MALIWSEKRDGICYEVRSAGQSLRLYSNGVFHSQWHPKHVLSGHLWDLLLLPAFLSNPTDIKSALILGVGGGTIIRALNQLFELKRIVGVELDPTHLFVAKTFFGCTQANIQFVHCEAQNYVSKYKRKYDYIVEDIFIENPKIKGDAVRAIKPDHDWFECLETRLKTRGILVSNFETKMQLMTTIENTKFKQLGFIKTACLQSLRYENAIGVFARFDFDLEYIPRHLEKIIGARKTAKLLKHFIFEII